VPQDSFLYSAERGNGNILRRVCFASCLVDKQVRLGICIEKKKGIDSMDRKEIKAQVAQLLSGGVTKSDVFARLTGQGVKDRLVAYFIAAHADPQRCRDNRGHRRAVLVIAYLQVFLGALAGFAAGRAISPLAGLIVAAIAISISLLFVWGFSKNKVGAYNAYLILTLTQLPRQFSGMTERPESTAIALLIGLGLLAYIWYVRSRLFPDFAFMAPKKVAGKYVFSE
jgi:hypothetical protein